MGIKQVTREEFLKEGRFDFLIALQRAFENNPTAIAIVLFRNEQMDSSSFGQSSAMVVGPDNTFKSVQDCEGKWLKDLPSQRQYPICYTTKEEMFKC